MPWYNQGTVAVTANSETVTGTGTAFSANARVGDAFRGPDGRWYEITNIASATVLSIKPNYQGATASGQAYAIAPMQGYVKESADRLRQFVDQFGTTLGSLGAWSTAATADAALTSLGFSASGKSVARGTPAQGRAALELVKQTSPTDTAAGAVATTDGARFAVLANYGNYYSSSAGKNIDTLVGGESGLFSTGNPGTFPPGFGAFVYIETQQTYSASSVVQEAWDYGSSSVALGRRAFRVRSNTSGEWSAWQVYYHSGNLVGTVSQSGGVPTGAIIERGSNANGEYVRFADGTQICWLGNASAEFGLRVASVSEGATGTVIWGFPAAFASPPQVTADWGSADGSIRVNGQPQRLANRSTTQCPINWQALQSVGGTACQLDAVAIGRWHN